MYLEILDVGPTIVTVSNLFYLTGVSLEYNKNLKLYKKILLIYL